MYIAKLLKVLHKKELNHKFLNFKKTRTLKTITSIGVVRQQCQWIRQQHRQQVNNFGKYVRRANRHGLEKKEELLTTKLMTKLTDKLTTN